VRKDNGMRAATRDRDLSTLLGGLAPRAFLARHWQKRPLLVRGALAGAEVADRRALFDLARREDVESRLVSRIRGRWALRHGPFKARELRAFPRRNATLLVQGVNLFVPAAEALLRRFAFVPYARLDDVMVSYAVPGGGVGPHFDSYDVFLIQARGRRRWRISAQRDRALDPGAPLRLLARFAPEAEWVLDPGDMLYLPPGYAHDGVALDECTTVSVGFRAPSADELAREFLAWLGERTAKGGHYADPDLVPQTHPAALGAPMIASVATMLASIRWSRAEVARFLGSYLSEPKPGIVFTRPSRPLSPQAFARRCAAGGVHLDPRTMMLFHGARLFVNGEEVAMPPAVRKALVTLADTRALPVGKTPTPPLLDLLHGWYVAGYLYPGRAP
jgi:50S ribosomal protein L16 3-hydroxylase